ncbi:hypothetical protein FGG08_001057 [Glutinoglossum americanum]|uniref:Uncharacterized protein n=1 Tax=Glutinoglossum americanum TaxID=1670608 RepID=A0A9P8L0M5_9PEZI|nr:hypothetical protein FGG08_001057 [Glutinoglossum americanum]
MAIPTKRKLKGLSAGEEDPVIVPKAPESRRTSRRNRRGIASEQGEEEHNLGRSESQQFLQLSRAFAKKRNFHQDSYIASFEERVQAEGKKLLKVILSRKEDMYGTLKDISDVAGGLLSVVKTQSKPASPCAQPSDKNGIELTQVTDQRVLPTMHGLYVQGNRILKLSAALIGTYEDLCMEVIVLDRNLLVGQTWEKDAQRVEHLLEGGRKIAEEQIVEQADKRMARGKNDPRREQDESTSKRDGWDKVAKQTSKGIQRLVKTLPREK